MFAEQVGWAAEAGVDFVIAETIDYPGEALLALEAIKAHDLDAVVTLTIHRQPIVRGGVPIGEACRRLQDAGADVVGLNCIRGPATMLPLLAESAPRATATSPPCRCRTARRKQSQRSNRSPTQIATCSRKGDPPDRARPVPGQPLRDGVRSRRRRRRSESTTSASVAAAHPTTSARWPRRSAARRRRAGSARI